MFNRQFRMAAVSLAILVFSPAASAAGIPIEEKIALQASMSRHIEEISVDGLVPHVDLRNGTVVDLVPSKAHPMILAFGDKFVLCTDFRDPQGNFVNVDYYMTKRLGTYIVFQTEVNNRGPLEALVKAGKASEIR